MTVLTSELGAPGKTSVLVTSGGWMVAVTTCVERLAEEPEPTVWVTVITSVLGEPVT